MTGIDSVAAALLASRLDSLLNGTVLPAAGGAAAAQVGTPAAGTPDTSAATPAASAATAPQASAQTALSDVGLALDAISRYGGDAAPAVAGRAPLLADPSILLADVVPQTAMAGGANPAAAQDATRTAAEQLNSPNTSAIQAAQDQAAAAPIAALRTALAQAVGESGLFYESHVAQWLTGQRSLAALAREPQARLASSATPADAAEPGRDTALDDLLAARLPTPTPTPTPTARTVPPLPAQGAQTFRSGAAHVPSASAPRPFIASDAMPSYPGGMAGNAHTIDDAAWTTHARAALADAPPDATASPPAQLHPEAVQLVRQQLDVLATDQFRWIGEAWPGARLDWTIEPDSAGAHVPRDADEGGAWRTRLTLTLPSLGTVDAELVLKGEQVVARLRANQAGAGQLTRHEAALRQRLQASGLQLGGLSIRGVDSVPDGFDAAAAHMAAAAYARGASGAAAVVPGVAAIDGADDWALR